jgi:hypothetical protein
MSDLTQEVNTAPVKKQTRKRRVLAPKADTVVKTKATEAPVKTDTAPIVPKKLPHLSKSGLINNAAGDPPIPAAPGFHLSTCGNDSKQRTRYGQFWHMCRPGEGYVLDEGTCDCNDPSGFLLYNGDVVMAMNSEDYEEYRRLKGAATLSARRKQAEADKEEIEAISRRQGEKSAHIPGEFTLKREVGELPDPDNMTI